MPVLILLALLITGCLGTTTYRAQADIVYVDDVPPAPLVEELPVHPGPEYLWIDGYWGWNGVRYVWVRGYWAPRPRPGWIWVRSGWIVVDGRYHFVAGRWAPSGYTSRVRYVHPAPTRKSVGTVKRPIKKGAQKNQKKKR